MCLGPVGWPDRTGISKLSIMNNKLYLSLFSLATVFSVSAGNIFTERLGLPSKQLSSSAASPAQAPAKIKEVPQEGWINVINEDFSAMTEGTPDTPTDIPLTDEDIIISSEYTAMPDWSGAGVYQAGGTCAINFPGTGGYLNTPEVQMQGLVKVAFDAKVFDDIRAIDVFVCNNGIDDPLKVAPYQTVRLFNTDGWEHVEMYFHNPYEEVAFVQFRIIYYGATEQGAVFDNVKVDYQPDYIPPVTGLKASGFTSDSFNLSWSASDYTDNYIVSVYEVNDKNTDNRIYKEDFESFTADENGILTTVPEGWQLGLRSNHSWLVEYKSGKALAMGRHEEIIEFPSFGGRFVEFRFDMAHILGDHPKAWGSQVAVEGWNGDSWEYITSFSTEGEDFITVDLGEWEEEEDFFEIEEKIFRGRYTKIRLVNETCNYGTLLLVDNVEFECESDAEMTCVVDGESVQSTRYTFNGLNPDARYFASVRAASDNFVSEEKVTEAFGIAAPAVLPADDVTETSFIARWEPAYLAAAHSVSAYDCLVIPQDVYGFSLLDEDFELVTDCADSYYHPDRVSTSLNEYTRRNGWTGNGVGKVNGHLGCMNCIFEPGNNYLISPDLTLSNNDGHFRVTVKVWGKQDSRLVVMSYGDGLQSEPFAEDGIMEFTFDMQGGQKHDRLAFVSYDGQPFFIDEVKVTQDLCQDDLLLQGVQSYTLGAGADSMTFEMERAGGDWYRAYDVAAARVNYTQTAVSDYSETVIVEPGALTGIKTTDIADACIVSLQGLQLSVTLLEAAPIEIYAINGYKVNEARGISGVNVFTLPDAGVYMVKAGTKTYKVLAR